jgi:hypothetical protein
VWTEPGTITIVGPLTVLGMRYWTYIWPVLICPAGTGPVGPGPGWVESSGRPLTKKLPKSCNSSGPPSEPAVAVETLASRSISESASLHASFDSLAMIVMAFSRIVRPLSFVALGQRVRIVAPFRAARETIFTIEAIVGVASPDVRIRSRSGRKRADVHAFQPAAHIEDLAPLRAMTRRQSPRSLHHPRRLADTKKWQYNCTLMPPGTSCMGRIG